MSRIPNLAVYDPNAPKSLFLAAHTPFPLKVRSSANSAGDGSIVNEKQLVDLFYGDPNPDGASLYAVLGDPGTGKSQLIRLIDFMRDRSKGNQHVVYIPKRDTDLRGALRLILEGLKGAEYEGLQKELVGAISHYHDPLDAERRLWSEIGLVLQLAKEGTDAPEIKALNDLLPYLTSVVIDAHFEKCVLEFGAPKRLISRALGNDADSDEETTGLEFTRKEIDEFFQADKIAISDMSRAAREAWNTVASLARRNSVLELLNRYVSNALHRVFWANQTSLVDLMNQLRTLLHRDGKELVLLIEDMSVLSGVQMEFFQALITTVQDKEPTAPIRSMFAITPGYFNTLRETVRQRIGKVIEVQSSIGQDDQEEAIKFFVRYLNAARISDGELDSLDIDVSVPNACQSCSERLECHEAFGEIDGQGLFPFSERAFGLLKNGMIAGDQVPRKIVGTLFRDFLLMASQDLQRGNFPSEANFSGFNSPQGRTPSASVVVDLQRQYPTQFEKVVRFQRYWAKDVDSYEGGNAFLLDAFQLPPSVTTSGTLEEGRGGNAGGIVVIERESKDDSRKTRPDPFREWMSPNGILPMDESRKARKSIFEAVCITLETVYGLQTETTLISSKAGFGKFFRPDSILLEASTGGGNEETTSYQTFRIEKNAANVSAIQALVEKKHSDPNFLGAHIAWVDSLAEKVFKEYLARYNDDTKEIGILITASQIFTAPGRNPSSLENILCEVNQTDELVSGRSGEWRKYVEVLRHEHTNAIAQLKEKLSNGRGRALTTRVKAVSRNAKIDKIVQDSETKLIELVKNEVHQENELRSSIRDLIGAPTIDDVLPMLKAEVNRLERNLSGQVVSVAEIERILKKIQKLETLSLIDLAERNTTDSLTDLLLSLTSNRRSDLDDIASTLKELIVNLEQLTFKANEFARVRGYPQDLLSVVEKQFADFGLRKGA